MKFQGILVIIALIALSNCWSYAGHQMRGDASKAVYDGIKKDILGNISKFANQTTAAALKADLQQTDKSKLALKTIDNATVNQIFSLFGITDPGCDANNNGYVEGNELKCLGKLWKYYVPS